MHSTQTLTDTVSTVKTSVSWYQLTCVACQATFTEQETTTRCLQCGQALDVTYSDEMLRSRVDANVFSSPAANLLEYIDLFPLDKDGSYISLHEGNTTLMKLQNLGAQFGLQNVYVKNESLNPTGVFKDRGSLVEVTKAKQLGANGVVCASTGNMAASVSAYAAIAGLPSFVFVPEGTPLGKLAQSLAYGAHVIGIRGTYNDCVEMCEAAAASQKLYLAGDYAFRAEGQKTISYEVYQQLSQQVPDVMILPMGCGTNIAAAYKGWLDLKRLGVTNTVPRMIGVQPDSVPTIVAAWQQGLKEGIEVENAKSVASAVGIGKPLDDMKALQAIYDSNGYALAVPEEEIVKCQYMLGQQEGLFVEPSSALTIAALPLLKAAGVISETDTVVTVLTGTGLKDPQSIVSIMPAPHVLEPDMDAVNRYFTNKLYTVRSVDQANKAEVIWHTAPSQEQMVDTVKAQMNLVLEPAYVQETLRRVHEFFEKADAMKQAELQGIVENVLKEYYGEHGVLRVRDFEVHTQKHKKPLAWVQIEFNNEVVSEHAVGVGPVDALLKALHKSLEGRDDLNTQLTNYNVDIYTGGADAVVNVELTLKDIHGTEVTGTGTSPDVIVASIEAFTSAYNILYYKQSKEHTAE